MDGIGPPLLKSIFWHSVARLWIDISSSKSDRSKLILIMHYFEYGQVKSKMELCDPDEISDPIT